MNRTVVRGVVALLLIAGPAWPQSEPLTRLWKGKELWEFGGGRYFGVENSWQEMPGAVLAFQYEGKGPLPKPIEFVIPLAKPLPLGTYRLFVKNFYLGRMEATLGDITLPLPVRRFDWTPGVSFEANAPVDKIVLRYFASEIIADTGAKQEQNYIVQGVCLTTENKVPIRAGELVTTLPEERPPLREGNYLQNGGFECGLYPWGKAKGHLGYLLPGNLDPGTAAEGKTSLKVALRDPWALESKMVRLAPGPYALSFYAKADRPVRLEAAVCGFSEDLKDDVPTKLSRELELTGQWARYVVKGEVDSKPGLLYSVRFRGKQETPSALWLDAVQLQNGDATEFRPAIGAEVGIVCDLPGRIVYEGQQADADLLVTDSSDAASAAVEWRVVDFWGKEAARGRQDVPLSDHRGKAPLTLFAARRGIFRVLLTLGASTSETTYSVLPPNPHLDRLYPQGSLGVDTAFVDPAHLAVLKRANFNWAISKFIARWYLVEPKKGQFKFDDEAVAAAARAKLTLVLQPLNLEWGVQEWLRPYWKPAGGASWDAGKRRFYMEHWATFIEALVGHYKDSVKHWEIENEPNCVYSAQEYGELLKRASEKIRRVDPQATVVAVAGGGYPASFYEEAIRTAGPESFDKISVHFYGNEVSLQRSFAELLRKHGKAGWNSETGGTCPTFYTTLPDFESLRQKEYVELLQRELRRVAAHSVQNYLLSLSEGGMERWFHYFARGVNAGPAQHTARFGGGKELTEYDGALRANAVALSIASHFVDEAKYYGPVELDRRLQMYVFGKNGGSVGCCWASESQPLRLANLPRALTFYDIMGNALSEETPLLTDSVVYFTGRAAPAECVQALRALSVRER